jgi:Mg2+-importing ATPase
MSAAGIAFLTAIPFTAFGRAIGFAALPPVYFAYLAATILLYMTLATVCKKIFIRRYGTWL